MQTRSDVEVSNIGLTPVSLDVENSHEHTWVLVQAVITSLDNRNAVLTLEDNTSLTINPRPWRFALEQGFQAELGDTVLLVGFYENGKFELAHLRNVENGSAAQIRDEQGNPLWNSGGGDS